MALNIDLYINDHPIGYIGIQRTDDSDSNQYEYKYTIKMRDGETSEGEGVKHRYDDGAVRLLLKVLEDALSTSVDDDGQPAHDKGQT